jgi:hypothetical protein
MLNLVVIHGRKPKSTPSSNLMMKWLSKGKKETSAEPSPKRIKTEAQ